MIHVSTEARDRRFNHFFQDSLICDAVLNLNFNWIYSINSNDMLYVHQDSTQSKYYETNWTKSHYKLARIDKMANDN